MNDVATQLLTADQVAAFVARAGGAGQVLRVLSGELSIELPPASGELVQQLSVPVGVAFEQRVDRGGYGWRNPELTEALFPVAEGQAGEYDLKRFHFARSISSVEAIRLIREDGYEPAETGHILAFGEASPEEQRRHPVIGLGSAVVVAGSLSVPALWFDGDRRTLDLIWYDGDWHRNYRFLGVRRISRAQGGE